MTASRMASHYRNCGVVALLFLLTLCGTTGTNRSVSLWVENVTTFATKPAVGAAVRAHAPFLDKLFVAGEGSSDSYILAVNGSLLPIQPAGQLLMSAFVKQQHAWGLKVVPMIGAEARPHVMPALWALLHSPALQNSFIKRCVNDARRYGYDGYQLDMEPGDTAAGGLSAANATLTLQPSVAPVDCLLLLAIVSDVFLRSRRRLFLDFLARLASALHAIGVEHVSAAGYAGCTVPGVVRAKSCAS